eukprot:8756641-Prorocentrum_lima.AAC.1
MKTRWEFLGVETPMRNRWAAWAASRTTTRHRSWYLAVGWGINREKSVAIKCGLCRNKNP